jgi:hypothetical protein
VKEKRIYILGFVPNLALWVCFHHESKRGNNNH